MQDKKDQLVKNKNKQNKRKNFKKVLNKTPTNKSQLAQENFLKHWNFVTYHLKFSYFCLPSSYISNI